MAFTTRLAAMLLAGVAATNAVAADDYPNHAVRIVVPFAAGGSADIYARVLAQRLQASLKQPFIVEDRPGAGSIIGTDTVARSEPDGYTLLLMSNTHTVNESLFATKPFRLMTDFTPVAPINQSDLVLVVNPALQVATLADLISLAKAKPGKLTYASSGPGTPYHMAGELFKAMAGIDLLHVPYKSSAAARSDVLSDQVDLMFDAETTIAGLVQSGKLRALATTGTKRSSTMKDVPTMAEAGVPGYDAVIWLGMMAPKNTPAAITGKLNAEIARIVADPALRQAWAQQGATPMTMSIPEFTRYLNDDIRKWAHVVQVSGARVDR